MIYLRSIFSFIFFSSLFLSSSYLLAQDLSGFQKLRGEVLSSTPDDEYTSHAFNAFDTNEGTYFRAKDIQGWVGLDLKSKQRIRKVRILPRPDGTSRLLGSIIQGARDANFTNPTNLYTILETPEAGKYNTYDIVNPTEFQFVRCISPDNYCNLAELEFYGGIDSQVMSFPQLTNIPTVYIETYGNFDFVDKSNYVSAYVIVSNDGYININTATVRGRGNSTWEFMEKKPFRIRFDKKQRFLGMPANARSWTLIANAVDKTFLRNPLAFEMSRFFNFEYTPSHVMVDVYLDGFYYGNFMASDQIQVNEDRIEIDEMVPGDINEPQISGGYHLEIDAYAHLEPVFFSTNRNIPFTIKSPDSDFILPVQKNWIHNHINKLEDLLFQDAEAAIDQYIDIESAVKYYLHSELTGNCDAYWCIPCYKKRDDDKLYFGPVWDFDQAFLTNERVPRFFATLDTQHGFAQSWFRQIMRTETAQQVLKVLWREVIDGDLKQQLIDYLEANAALLQQSQVLNYQRWNSLHRKVHFEQALFNTYDEYIEFVQEFIDDRFNWFGDTYQIEKRVILPTSSPGNPLQTWQYTTSTPADDWYKRAFDASSWQTGEAPFGRERNLQNTEWRTNQIYIRTSFYANKEDLDVLNKAYFETFHDEDVWIYLNGELALERSGYITEYQSFEFDKTHLREGWNTLAVKCIQTVGGQLIDVGVWGTVLDDIINKETDTLRNKFTWFVLDGVLHVNQIEDGSMVYVYSVEGSLLKQEQVAGESMQIRLPNRGIYFIRTNGTTIKVLY